MKHHRSIDLLGLLAIGALVFAQGCADDGEENDKPDMTIPVDTGGKNSTGGKNGGSSGSAGKASSGGAAGDDSDPTDGGAPLSEGGTSATSTDGGTGNEGGTGPFEPPACALPDLGTNGCFNCPADNETEQWLNRCTPGLKYDNSFDNATRVPLLPANGKLPPFPS